MCFSRLKTDLKSLTVRQFIPTVILKHDADRCIVMNRSQVSLPSQRFGKQTSFKRSQAVRAKAESLTHDLEVECSSSVYHLSSSKGWLLFRLP